MAPHHTADRRAADARLAERRRAAARPADAPLAWVAAACVAGAPVGALTQFAGLPAHSPAWVAGVALAAWAVLWRSRRDGSAAAALVVAFALLAGAWGGAAHRLFASEDLGRFARIDAAPVCFEGIVRAPPTVYPAEAPSPYRAIPSTERTVVELRVTRLRDGAGWREAAGLCEVTVLGRMSGSLPGDRLRVFGQLRAPAPRRNPGERDEAAAERTRRRLAAVWAESPECVTTIGRGNWSLARWAAGLRDTLTERLAARLPASGAPLARAMLLGDVAALDPAVVESFRHTGTLHLLVVSGQHVGLVAAVLPALAAVGLAPRRGAWVAALVLVGVYVGVAGGRPPALRAGVAAAAACAGGLLGRRALGANSLAGAAVVVFAAAPGAWRDAGTQLSFAAAGVLVAVAREAERRRAAIRPPLQRLIESSRGPGQRWARRLARGVLWGAAATAAVQLVVDPLIAASFHLLSPAAAPLSVALAPLVVVNAVAGLATLAADGFGLGPLADLLGYACGGAAAAIGVVVGWGATLPAASVWVAGPPEWWVPWQLGGCAAIAGLRACGGPWRGAALRGGLALTAAAFAPSLWQWATESPALRCSFLAVGHGSATLVETPAGGRLLFDAGALGPPERVTDTISGVLGSRGVRRLDAVLITHADLDHYNALPGLLDRFDIGEVWTTAMTLPRFDDRLDRSGPAELQRLLARRGVPVRTLRMGDRIDLGGALLEVLHPDDLGVVGSDNANSLVVGIEHAGRRVLLPGDLESPGVEALLAQEPYRCDVLVAPHHGSRLSDPPGFAAWCRPGHVVVSSGEPSGEAQRSFAEAGAGVWPTHGRGMVVATLAARRVAIRAFLGEPLE